jgi:hypothetical protein
MLVQEKVTHHLIGSRPVRGLKVIRHALTLTSLVLSSGITLGQGATLTQDQRTTLATVHAKVTAFRDKVQPRLSGTIRSTVVAPAQAGGGTTETVVQSHGRVLYRRSPYELSSDTLVLGVNERYAFAAKQKAEGQPWLLLKVSLTGDVPLSPVFDQPTRVAVAGLVAGQFAIAGRTVEELLDASKFVATDVTQPAVDRLRLAFRPRQTSRPARDEPAVRDGWVEIDPAFGHVVRGEVRREFTDAKQVTTVVNRFAASGEPPLLAEQTVTVSVGESNQKQPQTELRTLYDLSVNRKVGDDEFRLTALGLPEPVGVEWAKPTPTYVWLLLAAAVAAASAVLIARLRR